MSRHEESSRDLTCHVNDELTGNCGSFSDVR
jgi:hypothetical protein